MRLVLHVLGMFVLGAVALVAAGLLHHDRVMRPVAASPPVKDAPEGPAGVVPVRPDATASGTAVQVTVNGLAATLDSAAAALNEGHRTEGVVALDAAYRVSDVLRAAVSDGAAADLFPLTLAARTAVADGKPQDAAAIARAAARTARSSPSLHLAVRSVDVSAYVGAVALSPAGERLGDVVAVRENTLQLAAGGLRNVLGFIDFSDGAPRHVPAGDILFGERRTVGHTMVIVVSAPRH